MNYQASSTTHHVYRRTIKGQAAAVSGAQSDLSTEQRRLLLLVNGFTPMDTLAGMASFEAEPEAVADALKVSGLIEDAGTPLERARLSNLCGSHCH